MPFDLFGQIPVSYSEIEMWVEAVAGITRSNWRFQYYVKHWNVAEKIHNWKLKHRVYHYDAETAAEIERSSNEESR